MVHEDHALASFSGYTVDLTDDFWHRSFLGDLLSLGSPPFSVLYGVLRQKTREEVQGRKVVISVA